MNACFLKSKKARVPESVQEKFIFFKKALDYIYIYVTISLLVDLVSIGMFTF